MNERRVASSALRTERPTRQTRSRETLTLLLDATEALLSEGGLEAATIESIATRAGLAVGTVYKRFHDKDGLLRAAYIRFFETRAQANARSLADPCWEGLPAAELLRAFLRASIRGASETRGVLAAFDRFAALHPSEAFRDYARRMTSATHHRLVELLVASAPARTRAQVAARAGIVVDAMLLALRAYLVDRSPPGGRVPGETRMIDGLTQMAVRALELDD